MKRIIVLFFATLLILIAGFTTAYAFEDATLATAASQYQQFISDRRAQIPADASRARLLRKAARYARQNLWPEAIGEYENLLAAGENNDLVWFRLAQAWQGDKNKRRSSKYRQRAKQAAYNAYLTAKLAENKARALFFLGALYEQTRRPKQAMAAWKEALGLQENPEFAKRYQDLVKAHAFRVRNVDIESDSATPRICLVYSEDLASGRSIHPEDYIAIQPPTELTVSMKEKRLCLEGVEHGKSYDILVRAGVPAESGERTEEQETFTAQVDNRTPTLGFRGSTYILPRSGDQGLPLTSVNVDKAKLQVLRINDRNLIDQIIEQRISRALDGYDMRKIAHTSGESVWSGEIDIESELNREVSTAIPMREVLDRTAPGIYVVIAERADHEYERWDNRASQWLIISDLGLSTFKGEDGMHVFMRSFDSAEPLTGIELKLYSRNNSELAHAVTDQRGYARFDPGLLRGKDGRAPTVLMAFGAQGDFNFLDLSRPVFDLSDRGVAGRQAPGPVDVFMYTERGVYRPGELVHLMALARDQRGFALGQDLPLTVRLLRPDQVEAERFVLSDGELGSHYTSIALADNARRGSWTVLAYTDPQAQPVGRLSFLVEDFVPQRLKLELQAGTEVLYPNQDVTVNASGRFLYGAPAARLKTEAELILREDPAPYPEYANYQFGLVQESFASKRYPSDSPSTDDEGNTAVKISLDEVPDTSRPLKAVLRVSLFEPGGRPVNQTIGMSYRTQAFAIGIKPGFDGALKIGQSAEFEVITLDAQGQRIAIDGLRYELLRENYEYYWYYTGDNWDYKMIIRDSDPIASARLATNAGDPVRLQQDALDWGRYRLEVYDDATGIASSVRFRVGWFVDPNTGDSPDRLQVTLDKAVYAAGDIARVHVKAPFAGRVLLTVAGNRLWTSHTHALDEDGSTYEIAVQSDWSPGAYVTATAFRPAASADKRGPGRAIGVAWLGLEKESRTLQITMDAPEELRPRQNFELPVAINNINPGEPAYLTVAAVDEGILQLTDFDSPAPLDHYLGKRRLGVGLLDLYGKLITQTAEAGTIRSGSDAAGRKLDGSGVRTVKTVALFSGPVQLDSDGQVKIPLSLPDFNGELRLMAVAWDKYRFGQADKPLLVRDPLVARVYLPRFLAPGDRAQLTLNVQNLNAPPGDYQLRLFSEGAVSLDGGHSLVFRVDDSSQQNSETHAYTLRGLHAGVGKISLELDGPLNFSLYREWEIGVRPAQPRVRERSAGRLAPGERIGLGAALLAPYAAHTGEVHISLSSRPNLNVPELLERLDRYPYGCLEQTTSRALPLLYFDEVTRNWTGETAEDSGLRQRVQDAVQRVVNMQAYAGGFGLWRADSKTEQWLSAYAMDFLTRAKEQNYLVPHYPYERGLEWLQERLNEMDYEPVQLNVRAYALYVLARAQRAAIGDLRYLHDNYLEKLPTRMAGAQLGAALARYGDIERAKKAFHHAFAADTRDYSRLRDYGSDLRNRAALLALLAEAGVMNHLLPQVADRLAADLNNRQYTSTQEQSWLLLAAHALVQQSGELRISLNGEALAGRTDPVFLVPGNEQLQQIQNIGNESDASAWYILSTSGIPQNELPAAREGFDITRKFYSRDGVEIQPDQIRQNDLVVAVITGRALTREQHQALVVDLLPAGFELENARLGKGGTVDGLGWLPKLSSTLHTELRDDRYVAALDLEQKERDFTLAYLARAVTPGDYRLPAVFVEDMYKPWHYARGALGTLRIQ